MREDGVAAGAIGRRQLLAGLAAAGLGLALTACTGSGSPAPSPTVTGGPDDPDRALRAEVAAAERALAGHYAAVLAAHRGLEPAASLAPRHPVYADAVLPTATSLPPPSPAAVPKSPKSPDAALRGLLDAEREAAKARAEQCGRATDPELARTLALVGAGCAGAAAVLSESVGTGGGDG